MNIATQPRPALRPSFSKTASEDRFLAYIAQEAFPCLAAKAAADRGQIEFFNGSSMDCPAEDEALLEALGRFGRATPSAGASFRSFAALFPHTPAKTPEVFEQSLWGLLQRLHERDAQQFPWDRSVDSNPDSKDFSMSLGGVAFFIVGLHPHSPRRARRFPLTALVFNLHRQFEQLRAEGRYQRFSEAIIARDIAFDGKVNPMLAEHGSSSEARQYSGRAVDEDWTCPFRPRR